MKIVFTLFLFICSLGVSVSASAGQYIVMTGNYPPFSYNKGLHVGGVSVDGFEAIMKMTDTPFNRKNVKLVEWKKAYKYAATNPKCVLLNVPRTQEVENSFKWVGPLCFAKFALIGEKGKEFLIADVKDAEKYSIGGIRGSDAGKELIAQGVDPKKVKQNTTYVQPLLQLKKGELDLMVHSDMATTYLMQRMRMDPMDYRIVHTCKRIPIYFAFSKDTDDALIKKYNDALASFTVSTFNGDSAFKKTLRKHLPKGPVRDL